VTSDPDLLSDEELRWYSDDAYDDTVRMAAELLKARELLTLMAVGVIADYGGTPGWAIWHEDHLQPLADARPDLAAYLDALPKERS